MNSPRKSLSCSSSKRNHRWAVSELRLSHLPPRLTVVRRNLRFLYQKRLIWAEDVRVWAQKLLDEIVKIQFSESRFRCEIGCGVTKTQKAVFLVICWLDLLFQFFFDISFISRRGFGSDTKAIGGYLTSWNAKIMMTKVKLFWLLKRTNEWI